MRRRGSVEWLYSVYRNQDDRLMALDVTAQEAARIMGVKLQSFYKMWMERGGRIRKWTVTRERRETIEKEGGYHEDLQKRKRSVQQAKDDTKIPGGSRGQAEAGAPDRRAEVSVS